jgi:hypothetical protein
LGSPIMDDPIVPSRARVARRLARPSPERCRLLLGTIRWKTCFSSICPY